MDRGRRYTYFSHNNHRHRQQKKTTLSVKSPLTPNVARATLISVLTLWHKAANAGEYETDEKKRSPLREHLGNRKLPGDHRHRPGQPHYLPSPTHAQLFRVGVHFLSCGSRLSAEAGALDGGKEFVV